MAKKRQLDEKDLKLVELLRENAWITHAAAGEAVHLSASAVQRRIDRLLSEGVITGAKAVVNDSLIGRKLHAYLLLELNDDSQSALESLVEELQAHPEVTQVDLVSGKFDIILTVDCEDTDSFTEFAMNTLNPNQNIRHCWTLMRLKKLL